MADDSTSSLASVFERFCSYGKGSGAAAAGPVSMDNVVFAKMCRDCELLDKHLTRTDADLVFAKVKGGAARRISFAQFRDEVLPQLAERKYRGVATGEGVQRIKELLVRAGAPKTAATSTATSSGIYSKLTDSSQYTGAHRSRTHGAGFRTTGDSKTAAH